MNLKFICKKCGKEFEKPESMIKYLAKQGKEPKFCSRKCSDLYQNKQVETYKFVCLQCKEEFTKTGREVRNYQKKSHDIKFCSKKCKSDYWGKNRVEVECPVCGEKFLKQKVHENDDNTCSPKCAKIRHDSFYTIRLCEHCGKDYKIEKTYIESQESRGQSIKFCSKECFTAHIRLNSVEIICDECGNTFFKNKDSIGEHNFCNGKCLKRWRDKQRVKLICEQCGKEFITTKYKAEHGRRFCNIDCWNNCRVIDKDSYAQIAHYLRTSKEYDNWRLSVLKKAGFKCSDCGKKGVLQAHHDYPLYKICNDNDYSLDKILKSNIFNDINNGKSLCLDCHMKRHPHLQRNKKGQFCRPEISSQKSLDD